MIDDDGAQDHHTRIMLSRRMPDPPAARVLPAKMPAVLPALAAEAAHLTSLPFDERLAILNARGKGVVPTFIWHPTISPKGPPEGENSRNNKTYEQTIADGEIPTRDNWHDTYNALVWLAFPKTKAAISALHADILARGGEAERLKRGPARDYLTLFDECGIVVVTDKSALWDMLRNKAWHGLFADHRLDVVEHMAFHVVGHGTHDALFQAHVGLGVKALHIDAPASTPRVDVDAAVAAHLRKVAMTSSGRDLVPVPLLGIPGVWADNAAPGFYAQHPTVFRK
jgi:Protein of unknown function (DUF3025)